MWNQLNVILGFRHKCCLSFAFLSCFHSFETWHKFRWFDSNDCFFLLQLHQVFLTICQLLIPPFHKSKPIIALWLTTARKDFPLAVRCFSLIRSIKFFFFWNLNSLDEACSKARTSHEWVLYLQVIEDCCAVSNCECFSACVVQDSLGTIGVWMFSFSNSRKPKHCSPHQRHRTESLKHALMHAEI